MTPRTNKYLFEAFILIHFHSFGYYTSSSKSNKLPRVVKSEKIKIKTNGERKKDKAGNPLSKCSIQRYSYKVVCDSGKNDLISKSYTWPGWTFLAAIAGCQPYEDNIYSSAIQCWYVKPGNSHLKWKTINHNFCFKSNGNPQPSI